MLSMAVFAQPREGQARLDSLLREMPRMKEDSAGVRLLVDIAREYDTIDPEQKIIFCKRLIKLAKKTNNRYGEFKGYNLLGGAYLTLSDHPNAYANYLTSLRISEEIHDTLGAAGTLLNIGMIFMDQGDSAKALGYFQQALPYAEKSGNTRLLIYVYGNIAHLQLVSENYEVAEKYALLGLEKAHEFGDPATTLKIEMTLAKLHARLKRYSLALDGQYNALEYFRSNGQKAMIANALFFLGETYLRIAQDSVTVVHDARVPQGIRAIANKAIDFLTKAIEAGRELGRSNSEMSWQDPLSQAYALAGQHELSLKAFQRYTALKDSLFTTENTTLITNMETKRMVELKEKDIEIARLEVEKKRNERWFFIAGIVLLLGIMGSLFRSFRKRNYSV